MNHTECWTELFGALLKALQQSSLMLMTFYLWLLKIVPKPLSLSLSALKPILTKTSGPTQLLLWNAFWTFNRTRLAYFVKSSLITYVMLEIKQNAFK